MSVSEPGPRLASAPGGEMAARVAVFDWARTPLGAMEDWPQSLQMAVGICLNSRFPMFVWWGPKLINIYNDAYIPVLGKRHPAALGRSAPDIWGEIWPVIGPQADAVMKRGEATWNERVLLMMERHGYLEETYFTWSYSPIRDEAGRIGGLFCACTEETPRVLAERERDRLEVALREAGARYRSFIHLSSEGIWRFELDEPVPTTLPAEQQVALMFKHAYLAECNDAMARMYGFSSAAEIVGWRLPRFHNPENASSGEFLKEFIRNGYRLADAESRETDRDGNERVFVNSFVGQVEGGRLLRAWGLQRDVTEQRRVEEERTRLLGEVAAQGEQLMDVFQRSPSFMVVLSGPNHVFELVNQRYYELVGDREILGKPAREALPEVEGQGFFELLDHVYTTGQPYVGKAMKVKLQRHAGQPLEERHVDFVYQPMRDATGKITGVFGHGLDLTERKLAEEALRESEAAFRELADSMPQIVFAARPDGHVDYFNRQWYEYTGLPPGSVGFESWKHVHTEEGLRRVMEVWPEALRTGEPYEIEYQLRRHDGQYRWHLGRARPIKDGLGNVVRWYGTNTDIHDHKQLQGFNEELLASERAARVEAERASESKSEFLATLSHELRTPLTPVLLTVSLMESHPALPEDLKDDVATIRRNVELESRLISDLLDLTRITRGKLQLDMQDVDLHLIIRSAIDICQREASAKLTVDLKASRHTIRGDNTRLQQVFWNLINNAIKFTGAEGTITVRSFDGEGGKVVVEVIDTGQGIDSRVMPKLFNAFEQGDVRVVRQQAGLGLGLAISRKLAEAHGGTIRAASPGRGKGATFTVELPVVAAFAPVAVAPRAAATAAEARVLSILLIEDHEATLGVMTKLLRGLGHRVTGAASAAAGIVAALREKFDLIISDLGLPDGSGLDVMRQLRERYQGKAIALTGYGMESDISASREAGFVEHLTKPVDLKDLEEAIYRVTARGEV